MDVDLSTIINRPGDSIVSKYVALWESDSGLEIEAFLQQTGLPDLSEETIQELIYTDYTLRASKGQKPELKEYERRFPQLRGSLQKLFEVHQAISSAEKADEVKGGEASILDRLGRFQIEQVLGSGGFGTVYRARDPQLQRAIALKILRITGNPQYDQPRIKRFLVEGRAGARLLHPNIVAVFDAGQDVASGEYYLAAAFISGTTLSKAIGGQRFELRRAARIVSQLASALDYAHDQGILHRDVKPLNVMLDEQGTPYLMDFGLARFEESESMMTGEGVIMGTAAYMSPEQAAGKQDEIGPAADQYSLGCLFYEMLTGETVFSGPVSSQINQQINALAPAPSAKNAEVPKDLDTICLKMLSKERENRYPNCGALAADLERWLADEPIHARRLTVWERWNRWRKRNPALAWLSISTATLLLLVAVISAAAAIQLEHLAQAERVKTAEVQAAARTLEREVYKQRVARARRFWLDNEVDKAQEQLDKCPVALRGWEWNYCQRLLRHGLLTITNPNRLPALAATFSPDGKTLASVSHASPSHGIIQLRDANTGVERFSFTFPLQRRWRQRSDFLTFSPDGKRFAAACEDGVVRVWDTATKKQTWKLEVPGDFVSALAISPDSRRMVVGVAALPDTSLIPIVCDLETKKTLLSLKGLNASCFVSGIAFSESGRQIAAADTAGTIVVWESQTGEVRQSIAGQAAVTCFAFHPNERFVALGKEDNTIRIWDVVSGKLLTTLMGHSKVLENLAFSPDGKFLASASNDCSIIIWNADTFEQLRMIRGNRKTVQSIRYAPDNRRLVSTSSDGTIRIWDTTADQEFAKFNLRNSLDGGWNFCVRFSPDGKTFAAVEHSFQLYRTAGRTSVPQRVIINEPAPLDALKCVDFSPDGSLFAVGGKKVLKVCSVADGREVASFPVDGEVRFVNFNPMGSTLVWSVKNAVQVADYKIGKVLRTYDRHQALLMCSIFSPDGKQVASASRDGMVRLWNAATGEDSFARTGPISPDDLRVDEWVGKPLTFRPDGSLAVAGKTQDNQGAVIELWDAATGKTQTKMKASGRFVAAIDFSRDGTRLVSGSDDGTISIWDVDLGEELFSMQDDGAIFSVDFSPDGTQIATGGNGLYGRIWDADPTDSRLDARGTSNGVRGHQPVADDDTNSLSVRPPTANPIPEAESWTGPPEIMNSIGMKLRLIPAGEFLMGSPDSDKDARAEEKPLHQVRINRSFYLGKFEVTQREWKAVMGTAPWEAVDWLQKADDFPATPISWPQAAEFCKKLSQKEGRKYRLPTEAEWEYACRGGQPHRFHFGNEDGNLSDYAWFARGTPDLDAKYPHRVGTRKANPFGLHDMHGNLSEWCSDGWQRIGYSSAVAIDPEMPQIGGLRVLRGGNWLEKAVGCRSAKRKFISISEWGTDTGFRVAYSPAKTDQLLAAPAMEPQKSPIVEQKESPKLPEIANTIGMKLALIPAGEFQMGSPESDKMSRPPEKPQHRVRITKPFYLGKFEVTQREWKTVMETTPWKSQKFGQVGDDFPAVFINWDDAMEFCKKLSLKEGQTYRLPTEAEWEYACRAGSVTRYHFGEDEARLGDYAWFDRNSLTGAHPVGLKKSNPFGLHDMLGNVWEWSHESLDDKFYASAPKDDPVGPLWPGVRGARGGSAGDSPALCRSTYRGGDVRSARVGHIGFRVVRNHSGK